jgi:DNA helicase II / ATP-dependent DNA helicase PcrA
VKICAKRQQILDAKGHTIVTGGPGSGKTTIALLKGLHRIDAGLEAGQAVLFLSFSKAAVARIAETTKKEIPKAQQKLLNIQTFHSFFWEILRTHGYLLGAPKRLMLLAPHDERALSNGIERNEHDAEWQSWMRERDRLFREEGRIAFDLFAPGVAELMRRFTRICSLIANRYPLIIVDEAQDTGPAQWSCVKALAAYSQTLCLADLDQQIFDFLPGIGPERIQQIEADLQPLHIDLGSENNRSPDSEIAVFGHDILTSVTRGASYKGVSQINFHPRAEKRDLSIRQSVGIIWGIIAKETGQNPESIALLASFDRGAAIISNALRAGAKPIAHKVLFDEASTLLSSRFLAFLMEPKTRANEADDLARALELLSLVFRANGSVGALKRSKEVLLWSQQVRANQIKARAALFKQLASIMRALQGKVFCGDPRKDWASVRNMLRESSVPELVTVDRDLQYLITFNRGKRIASGLASAWETYGQYSSARQILDAALAEDQILSGGEDLSGIHVMTMHKAKGKQFDGVIIFRCEHSSPFTWPRDTAPHKKSRKVLHVAITRARIHTLILNQAFPKCPILSQHKL